MTLAVKKAILLDISIQFDALLEIARRTIQCNDVGFGKEMIDVANAFREVCRTQAVLRVQLEELP